MEGVVGVVTWCGGGSDVVWWWIGVMALVDGCDGVMCGDGVL